MAWHLRVRVWKWSLAQMAPLNVRPPVPPPPLTTRCDAIARSPLDARDARAAGPAHVCQQEHSQPMNMSHHGLTGSHSSPRSQGCKGFRAGALRAGARTRQGHWVRGLEASSAPVEAVEDAEQLGDPRRKRTSTTQQAGWPPTREESDIWSGSAQCDLGVLQCANSVQGEIMPCARALRRTQPGPCHNT